MELDHRWTNCLDPTLNKLFSGCEKEAFKEWWYAEVPGVPTFRVCSYHKGRYESWYGGLIEIRMEESY